MDLKKTFQFQFKLEKNFALLKKTFFVIAHINYKSHKMCKNVVRELDARNRYKKQINVI